MLKRRIFFPLVISTLLVAAFLGACSRSAPTAANSAASTAANAPAAQSDPKAGIEVEVVTPQPIEGSITATGKILVTEDRVANIGPVNEGRIVRLFAGQGTLVKKGQKLAELESADIDSAEADYLKALADLENAKRTSAAEIKFNQETFDRTKLLVEKEITPAKNLQQAEHDLEVSKANGANSIDSAKVALTSARRHLLILGLKDAAIDALATKKNPGSSVFSLTSPISGIVVERNATIGSHGRLRRKSL